MSPWYSKPVHLKPDPTVGLSDYSISIENGNATCLFTRANENPAKHYRSLFIPHYMLTAYGVGSFDYHTSKRDVTPLKYEFNFVHSKSK